jgi:hypothetical protein
MLSLAWQAAARLPFTDDTLKAHQLNRKDRTARRREPIVSSPRVLISSTVVKLMNQSLPEQFLQVVVESPGPQSVPALRLPRHLLHDGVTVQVVPRERQKNVKRRSR